ncbi:MAG: efflux RND transporter periplasmic adaptor subunit [Lentisphaerae bacterium]|nr:efflux RND transporter periplasmic adaptor subunit [Lentisphaerota bacterium]
MKKIIIAILILCIGALGFYGFKRYQEYSKYHQEGFTSGNGRLEATEVSIAAKLAGRLETVSVDEGDYIKKGQTLAMMQLNVLNAKLAQAKAELKQKQSKLLFAEQEKSRYSQLDEKQATTKEAKEKAESNYLTALADVEAANANVQLVQEDINDSKLVSPVDGRVQYQIAQEGEVLSSGDRVLNLVDLTDVYMTFFVPEKEVGKIAIGADARIVLDAVPDTPIPAKISFVDPIAQFTPKTVETREERQKLMFRVKAKVDPELIKPYIDRIKTGLPGEAWVQLDPKAAWPEFLKLKREKEQK